MAFEALFRAPSQVIPLWMPLSVLDMSAWDCVITCIWQATLELSCDLSMTSRTASEDLGNLIVKVLVWCHHGFILDIPRPRPI